MKKFILIILTIIFSSVMLTAEINKKDIIGKQNRVDDPPKIDHRQTETVDGVRGVWINIKEPVEGFIFGYNFIYK